MGIEISVILSDIEATIKALENDQIKSKLVWDWYQSLMKLAKHNRVQLMGAGSQLS
jgi:hypothetical protein